VAALGEILRRFRFHGVPGAALALGVPADRTAELEAELAPVFSALEEAQRRADATVATASREAARLRADAVEHGSRLVAQARAGVGAARAEVVAARLAQASTESGRLLAAGQSEADRIGRVAAARLPDLVDQVVQRVLTLAAPAEAPSPDGQAGATAPPGGEPLP